VSLAVFEDRFQLRAAFTISRGSRTEARVLRVEVTRGGVTGRGECVPYARYGETVDSVRAQIAGLPGDVTRDALQGLLAPGAARNAVDCALWDLEAKQAGRPVWQLAGLRTWARDHRLYPVARCARSDAGSGGRGTRIGRC
jgi:L-alanine-DL-glutamate epimerase-like enolase superfamily enzyme